MKLNDFKDLESDRQTGVASLPVVLETERADRLACWVMAVPQVIMFELLAFWDRP